MSVNYEDKAIQSLKQLGLETALNQLDQSTQKAAAGGWSYSHFLGYLLEGEMQERHRKKVKMSLQLARFPYMKGLKDFNYEAQPTIDRRLIEELATGRYQGMKQFHATTHNKWYVNIQSQS